MYIGIQIVSVLGDCVLTNAVRMTNDSDCSGRVGQERTRAAANYISLDHCGSSSPSTGTWSSHRPEHRQIGCRQLGNILQFLALLFDSETA